MSITTCRRCLTRRAEGDVIDRSGSGLDQQGPDKSCTNHLIDTRRAIIVDVEATPARWTAEVAATKTMLERTRDRVGFKPRRLAADAAYRSGLMIEWLMQHEIEPHIPLLDREQDYHPDRMWAGARNARNERKRQLTE